MESEDHIGEESLEEIPTLHEYIDSLFILSGSLLVMSRDTGLYNEVNDITEKMDCLLVEMRHANWIREIG